MGKLVNEMNDNELENVNGGMLGKRASANENTGEGAVRAHCPICNKDTTFVRISGSRGKCQACGNVSMI